MQRVKPLQTLAFTLFIRSMNCIIADPIQDREISNFWGKFRGCLKPRDEDTIEIQCINLELFHLWFQSHATHQQLTNEMEE